MEVACSFSDWLSSGVGVGASFSSSWRAGLWVKTKDGFDVIGAFWASGLAI